MDWSLVDRRFKGRSDVTTDREITVSGDMDIEIEPLNTDTMLDSVIVHARQHKMLWLKEHCLDIAPGQISIPLNITMIHTLSIHY